MDPLGSLGICQVTTNVVRRCLSSLRQIFGSNPGRKAGFGGGFDGFFRTHQKDSKMVLSEEVIKSHEMSDFLFPVSFRSFWDDIEIHLHSFFASVFGFPFLRIWLNALYTIPRVA